MTDVIAVMPHLWIWPLVAGGVLLIGVAIWIWGARATGGFDPGFGRMLTGGFLSSAAALTFVVWILMLMPYDSKYHVLYRLEGKVVSVTNSFENGSGELSYTPVVKLDTYDHPILMKSSRIMALEGEDVTLTCTLSWELYELDTTYCGVAAIK